MVLLIKIPPDKLLEEAEKMAATFANKSAKSLKELKDISDIVPCLDKADALNYNLQFLQVCLPATCANCK